MKTFLQNLFTFINKLFPKSKKKISIWGRKRVYDNSISMLEYLINNPDFKDFKIICHFYHKEKYEKYKSKNVKIVKNIIFSFFHLFTSSIILHEQGMSSASFVTCRKQKNFDIRHGSNYFEKDCTYAAKVLSKINDYCLSPSAFLTTMDSLQSGMDKSKIFVRFL